jgi:hypothetical protein
MADASGGSGTLKPPGDDDFARVVPRRRRESHLTALPTIRDPLPSENAAFDPELESAAVALIQSRRRRLMTLFKRVAVRATARPLPAAVITGMVAVTALGALIAYASLNSGHVKHPSAATLSAATPKTGPGAQRSADRPIPGHHATHRRQSAKARHAITRRSARRHRVPHHRARAVHHSLVSTQATQPPVSTTPAPSYSAPSESPVTPAVTPVTTSSSSNSSSSSSSSSAGPTGAGAAFGPGY